MSVYLDLRTKEVSIAFTLALLKWLYTAYGLGPRYTKPGLKAAKIRAHHKYKKNIAMTDCLQAGQSVIAIFSLYIYGELGF